MRNFKVVCDVYYFGYLIFKKDDVIKFESEEYIFKNEKLKLPLKIENILNDKRFIEIEDDINIEIKEISEDDDLQIKKYRIQLDVMTSKKKLKEIENFIKNNIEILL